MFMDYWVSERLFHVITSELNIQYVYTFSRLYSSSSLVLFTFPLFFFFFFFLGLFIYFEGSVIGGGAERIPSRLWADSTELKHGNHEIMT